MTEKPVLDFLLVPDQCAGRRVRRQLATHGAKSGVLVGTWPRLLNTAAHQYFVPVNADAPEKLESVMARMNEAFWNESFQVAPTATVTSIKDTLRNLIAASDPTRPLRLDNAIPSSSRIGRRIRDLLRLAQVALPEDLVGIKHLLHAQSTEAACHIRVYHVSELPATTHWQTALINKLNRDADGNLRRVLQNELEQCLNRPPRADQRTVLRALQQHLYSSDCRQTFEVDETVQWIKVRDFYQEAEITAGMVQNLLGKQPALTPADIGILLPNQVDYHVALKDAFSLAGLNLSGLPDFHRERDLGRELVLNFLHCRQEYVPVMAAAAVLSSPLMPWREAVGSGLVHDLMRGRLRLPPQRCTEPSQLNEALGVLYDFLDGLEKPAFQKHANRAKDIVEVLQEKLHGAREINWAALHRIAAPSALSGDQETPYYLDGVTVLDSLQEPWRDVRHLFVLGFDESRYPGHTAQSTVFLDDELPDVARCLGLPGHLPSNKGEYKRRRQRFLRQLCTASDTLTFMIPHRDRDGKKVGPSVSMAFMRRLLKTPGGDEVSVRLVDDLRQRPDIRYLKKARPAEAEKPRAVHSGGGSLELQRNLLVDFADSKRTHHESPSSLERMLVSPLAWLMHRLDALPRTWRPEAPGPVTFGILVHALFGELFPQGFAQRSDQQLERDVDTTLRKEVQKYAPFLLSPQWRVELQDLNAAAFRAATSWQDILLALGPVRMRSEKVLVGQWEGLPVRGRSDMVLESGNRWRLIVDFKWSKSAKRLKQMEKGYELQASIYRAMADGREGSRVPVTAIAYYAMLDQVVLSDAEDLTRAAMAAWTKVDTDISGNAGNMVKNRLQELRSGTVRLPRKSDRDFLENECGIQPYALDASPLITLSIVQEEDATA